MRSILVSLLLLGLVSYAAAVTTYTSWGTTVASCIGQPGCPANNVWYTFTSSTDFPGAPTAVTLGKPVLNLSVGDRITFTKTSDNNSAHPLVICSNGGANTCAGAGINNLTLPIILTGQTFTWTAPAPGTYWYGCTVHPGMGAAINVVATGDTETICTYYTRALSTQSANAVQQMGIIDAIVTRAVTGCTTGCNGVTVGGIASPGALNRRFFDGSFPCINRVVNGQNPGTINFTDPNPPGSTAFGILDARLNAFFGTVLGCNAPGFLQANTASINPNMYQVHKLMMINNAEMQQFISNVINSFSSYVAAKPTRFTADGAAVTKFLNGFNRGADDRAIAGAGLTTGSANGVVTQAICTAADCPLSEYSSAAYHSATPMFALVMLLAAIAMLF
jgi:plastocyanin